MAFLPSLTGNSSPQNRNRDIHETETDKKSGYRVSLANINKTTVQHDYKNVSLCQNDERWCKNSKRQNISGKLPPLEEMKKSFGIPASYNEGKMGKLKPLKLPKCPNSLSDKQSMFWMEPLGIWVPLRQSKRLYEKFSTRIDLLLKDPDYFMDPCPHIPRCDHARSWSAVKLERQRFRELKELRNEELLKRTAERYENMQGFWLEQLNSRTDKLHATPSNVRLQNFRKTTGFLEPLNDSKRLERLQERQRKWEEAWEGLFKRREKTQRKESPENILPRIIVTDYEFVFEYDERVNINDQSCKIYFEEEYQVICRPVQHISDDNLVQNQKMMPKVFDTDTELNPSRNVPRNFDNTRKQNEVINETLNPAGKDSRSFDTYGSFKPPQPTTTNVDNTDITDGDFIPGNAADALQGENTGTQEHDSSASEGDNTKGSLLMTSYTNSGSSLENVIREVRLMAEIKQADNTANLMSQLVPVPLGVSSGSILDSQLTVSSVLDVYHTACQARLNNEKRDKNGGAWLPRKRDVSPYLQVDLGHVSTVQQVATQGNPGSAVKNDRHKRWVTKFTLEFSQDGKLWDEYHESGELKVFNGNFDLDSVVLNSLENTVEARYVRFRPKEWHNGIAMRVEVFGSNPAETDSIERPISPNEPDVSMIVEDSNDQVIVENQETQKFFREVEMTSQGVEFGLFVEESAVTPMVLHSPVFYLVSPSEQIIQIDKVWESQSRCQSFHLQEFDKTSEIGSSVSHEMYGDFAETNNGSISTSSEEDSEVITFTEEIEEHHEKQKDDEEEHDIKQHEEEDNAVTKESRPLTPTQPDHNIATNHVSSPVVPSPSSTTPPPTSPPLEGWAHVLERARADGSIKQQLMREKMAEERRKKLAIRDVKIKRRFTEQAIISKNVDELGDFLEKYCIIKEPDLVIFKNIFEKHDEDNDGFLWPEEVLEALESVNTGLLSDAHLRYVFRVLEHCDCQADFGIGLRLFSVIAAMSKRVALLNDKMQMLISKCDFKTLDCTLERVKMLFECYVNEDTMRISRTDLWIGLAAGGLRSAEATIDDYFSEKRSFDFLDFLTYLPLFQEIHNYAVENPLDLF